MIKANEIRLNNLFFYNYKTDLLSSVEWIQQDSINIFFERQPDLINGVVCSPNDLIPISITKEWLVKAGFKLCEDFKKGVYSGYYFKYPLKIRIIRDSISLFYRLELVQDIKFVHQLQNLYFALTGEELVFSLDYA